MHRHIQNAVKYLRWKFSQKAPSDMFDWGLNSRLEQVLSLK